MKKSLSQIFDKRPWILFLASILIIFSLLRIPSVSEPAWYGDESIYRVIGMALNHGRILYKEIWDNKPPLLYIIYAIVNGDLYMVRLLSLISGLFSVVVFFFIAKNLFKRKAAIYFSTSFFAIILGTPYLEGNIANAENFIMLPVLLAFYLILTGSGNRKRQYVIPGILLSIAFLTKIVAVFDLAAVVCFLTFIRFFEHVSLNKRLLKKEVKKLTSILREEALLIVAFVIPIIIVAFYFLLIGAFPDFWSSAFSQNVGYVGYGNNFLLPMGLLLFKLFLLIFSLLIIFRYRVSLGKTLCFILIWFSFSMFSAFFPSRPYTHYLLVLLPSFSLLLGVVLEYPKLRKVIVLLLVAVVVLVKLNFSPYKNILGYYGNYFSFLSGGSVENYQKFFDPGTHRNYELARFVNIKTTPNENIFVWSDGAEIYALSGKLPPGRYTVAYHISLTAEAIEETRKAIDAASPKYIIKVKSSPEVGEFLNNYDLLYKIEDAEIYEKKP